MVLLPSMNACGTITHRADDDERGHFRTGSTKGAIDGGVSDDPLHRMRGELIEAFFGKDVEVQFSD